MKTMLTAAVVVTALLAHASSASAYDATFEPSGAMSIASIGGVTFEMSGIELICNVTLSGSLNASFEDLEVDTDQDVGEITRVNWNSCSGGSVRAVLGLEWNVAWDNAAGTLPSSISSVSFTIEDFEWQWAVIGGFFNCLYQGDLPLEMAMNRTRTLGTYTTSTLSVVGAPLDKGSGSLCAGTMGVTGAFSMSPTQTLVVS